MVEVKKKTIRSTNSGQVAKEPKATKVVAEKKIVAKKAETVAETKIVKAPKKVAEKVTREVRAGLSVDLFDTAGKVVKQITLPAEVFGASINKELIAQAVRVYRVNQRQGDAVTKTRGEVEGSTRKIYRQKGTGRARHGGIRAPIFVKGGIAHGPKLRDFELSLPKKMKKIAFVSALSAKLTDGKITFVTGFETLEPKTKYAAAAFEKLGFGIKGRNVLLVLPKDNKEILRVSSNVSGVNITTADRINTYEILAYKNIVVMQDAIDALATRIKGKK